jgi:hypothetical protein
MISPFSLTRAIWNINEGEIKTGAEFNIPYSTKTRCSFIFTPEFVLKWSLSIHSFFSTIIHSSPDDLHLPHSFHAHTFFRWYLHTFRNQVYATTYDSLDSEILTVVVSTIVEISVALNDLPNPQRDFFFYTASYYAKLLATGNFRSGHPNVVSAVSTLLEALSNYKAHISWGIVSLEKMMETPSFSDKGWWEFLNLPEEKPTYGSEHGGIGEPGTMDLTAVQTAASHHVHFQSQPPVESLLWLSPTCEMQQEPGAASRHVHFQPKSSFLDVEKNQIGVESYAWPSPACEIIV